MDSEFLSLATIEQALDQAALPYPRIFDAWPLDDTVHPLRVLGAADEAAMQSNTGQRLSIDAICQALAQASGTPFIVLDLTAPNFVSRISQRAHVLPPSFANAQRVLIIDDDGKFFTLVSDQPFALTRLREIEATLTRPVRHVFTRPELLDLALIQMTQFDIVAVSNNEMLLADEIIRLTDWVWQYAYNHRASDIHIEPRHDKAQIRLRIDNQLHLIQYLPLLLYARMVSRIKVLAEMDVLERRRPQDGRIKLRASATRISLELRVAVIPTAFGEKCVVRIFDPAVAQKSLQELGFSVTQEQEWQRLTRQKNGLILVVGPTGSGKTSTMYTALRQLAQPNINVCTIEDPIEMLEPRFNQTQVNLFLGLTFFTGLRALLRLDPDILMVGEIRDQETAQLAIQAALTGHLVFSTVHTNNAYAAATRLLDLGVPEYLLRATLRGVLAQRLARCLCPACKHATDGTTLFEARGCSLCRHTGYKGRIGLFELLAFDQKWPDPPVDPMALLAQSGQDLIAAGITTRAEIDSVLGW